MRRFRLRRALCAALVTLALALPAAAGYTDVPANAWYAGAVDAVTGAGLMQGIGDGLFCPAAKLTRATVVVTLWRRDGSPETTASGAFSDVAEESWYAGAVNWAAEHKIASGDGKGHFNPDALITREQLAVFLYNYDQYHGNDSAKGVLELYTDASSVHAWAKTAMAHAVGTGLIEGSGYKLSPAGTADRAQLAVILQRMMTTAMG